MCSMHNFILLYRNVYFLLIFKGFVDPLDEEQRRRLLVPVLNNGRGSLDYARRLLENDEDPGDDPQPYPTNNGPRWCICHNCINMPTLDENKCCQRRECITSYELFHNLCIVVNPVVNKYHLIVRGLFSSFKAPNIINKLLASHVNYIGSFKTRK